MSAPSVSVRPHMRHMSSESISPALHRSKARWMARRAGRSPDGAGRGS
jgi:hypothetical protein